MAVRASGRVGRKGELFPPKDVREEAGLSPGDLVVYTANHGRIEVVKIPGLHEAYPRTKTAKVTVGEFEKMTSEVLGNKERRKTTALSQTGRSTKRPFSGPSCQRQGIS